MVEAQRCEDVDTQEHHAVLLIPSMTIYLVNAALLFVILVILIVKRGNFVAFVICLLFASAFTTKAVSFWTSIQGEEETLINITYYTDESQTECRKLEMSYAFYGKMYYFGEMLFRLGHFSMANVFIAAVIALYAALKVERLSYEAHKLLISSVVPHQEVPVETILKLHRDKLAELDKAKKKGKCRQTCSLVYCFVGQAAIVGLYVGLYYMKHKALHETFDIDLVETIDMITFFVFMIVFVNLLIPLIAFKVLDCLYELKVKLLQISMCIFMSISGMTISILQYYSGKLLLKAYENSPLPEYPQDDVRKIQILQGSSLILTFVMFAILAYLILEIGRSKRETTKLNSSKKNALQRLAQQDDDYVRRRLHDILKSPMNNSLDKGRATQANKSLTESHTSIQSEGVQDLLNDPDVFQQPTDGEDEDLRNNPRIIALFEQEIRRFNEQAKKEKSEADGMIFRAKNNLVNALLGDHDRPLLPEKEKVNDLCRSTTTNERQRASSDLSFEQSQVTRATMKNQHTSLVEERSSFL